MKRLQVTSMGSFSTITPALKSIHPGLCLAKFELVEIFMVGTYVPKGVPRPVVNNTMWHPQEARAVAATRSFPGAESRFKPLVCKRSPYGMTPDT